MPEEKTVAELQLEKQEHIEEMVQLILRELQQITSTLRILVGGIQHGRQ